jgi:uncharacterized membrane protein (Fun14 family)
MERRLPEQIETIVQTRQDRRVGRSRSPFTAKSVLLAGAVFIGALGYSAAGSGQGTAASWLQSLTPGAMTLSGSYLGGFFIGWGARRALKLTSVITSLVIAATGIFVWLGWDASSVQSWLSETSRWAGENIEQGRQYLSAFLPSAGAAGVGGVLGFRRR